MIRTISRVNESNRSFDRFNGGFESLINGLFAFEPSVHRNEGWNPRVDVSEDENAFHIRADLPGLGEKDVDVTLENGVLTISGERREERKEDDGSRRILCERTHGSFSRAIKLPSHINAEGIKAHFRDGVLHIEIPKSEEVKLRKIPVTVN